ncbi:uncharacterized protein LOC136083318 [Hydra vulgaris]|uniref:Uncharacterized protein LOC136083318 n=1 Tax=Hydra vulgaris TaxID=6087 RepID=A0ABM4CAU2_HYDVU
MLQVENIIILGVQYWIRNIFKFNLPNSQVDLLHTNINIDGMPLFNSNSISFWPILGSLKECPLGGTFPIAIYSSTKKPTSLDEYLNDFFSMKSLKQHGFLFNNKTYIVKIDAIICNAPARAFIKCIKPHSGYNSCERCMQCGKWCNKITLPNIAAPLITDLIFTERQYFEHHVGTSPLEELGCGMVTEFPLDYMHLVCLGAMRRILFQWIHGPRGGCKLS